MEKGTHREATRSHFLYSLVQKKEDKEKLITFIYNLYTTTLSKDILKNNNLRSFLFIGLKNQIKKNLPIPYYLRIKAQYLINAQIFSSSSEKACF